MGLLVPRRAEANTPFANFAFPATGSPTARTMPNRLAEIHNVLDFGADPTGGNASATTAAIQAAVDVISGAGRGTVYFPLGFYSTNAAITFNLSALSICFRGEGNGTTVAGNFNGFIFDRHLGSPSNTAFISFEKMVVQNGSSGSSSGAIRCGSTTQGAFRDLQLVGFAGLTTEDSAGNSSQNILIENVKFQGLAVATSPGLVIGGSGALLGCDFIGYDVAVVAYGNGLCMAGNRIERCNTAYQFGCDSAGTDRGMSGFSVNGSTEGNTINVYFKGTCTGGFVGPLGMLGHDSSNSGMTNGVANSQYGLLIDADKAQGCTFLQLVPNSWFDVAGISIANATARANNVFSGCIPTIGAGTGVPWIAPTNAYTAQFLQCNTQPIWTFAQLPTGGNVLEGDEFSISNSTTATWGANVTMGGGSSRVLIRYNGTNWTVVGK